MIPITFRPLVNWPQPNTTRRRPSTFSAGWSSTLELVDRELRQLNARQVVIQIDVSESDIRLDGWPKASANPDHPGVILSFESKHGPLRYVTDTFPSWKDNLRAIALGLEALRKVDRYGITKSGEQYTGWRQLTAGSGLTTTEAAETVIAQVVEMPVDEVRLVFRDDEASARLYRQALKRSHPDGGGNTEVFAKVQDAGRLLGIRS